jgi:glycosyltransferase involved in cell wall biosynthesis
MLFASIARQTYPAHSREILLVDNASTDNTRLITEEFSRTIPGLQYFYEESIGLSIARNRGYREAKGFYVGYLDDDARIPPHWLSVAAEIASRIAPPAFGGPYYAFYLSSKPDWFKDEYGSYIQDTKAGFLNDTTFLVGGNIFIQRAIIEYFHGFDPNFGMAGKKIAYGEETHLLEKIRLIYGYESLYYDPRLYIEHLVRTEKMKWNWIVRQRYADGRDYYNLFPDKKKPISSIRLIYRTTKNILLLIFDLIFRVFLRDREKYPHFQNFYFEHTTLYIAALGQLAEQVKEKAPYARR